MTKTDMEVTATQIIVSKNALLRVEMLQGKEVFECALVVPKNGRITLDIKITKTEEVSLLGD